MAAAVLVGRRSSCVRRKVGAIVLSEERRVIGAGWNIEQRDLFLKTGQGPTGAGGLGGRLDCATDCPRAKSDVPTLSTYSEGAGRCISQHAEITAYRDACLREDGGYPAISQGLLVVTYTPCPECQEFIDRTRIQLLVKGEEQ